MKHFPFFDASSSVKNRQKFAAFPIARNEVIRTKNNIKIKLLWPAKKIGIEDRMSASAMDPLRLYPSSLMIFYTFKNLFTKLRLLNKSIKKN